MQSARRRTSPSIPILLNVYKFIINTLFYCSKFQRAFPINSIFYPQIFWNKKKKTRIKDSLLKPLLLLVFLSLEFEKWQCNIGCSHFSQITAGPTKMDVLLKDLGPRFTKMGVLLPLEEETEFYIKKNWTIYNWNTTKCTHWFWNTWNINKLI